jgi:hypothetical protein
MLPLLPTNVPTSTNSQFLIRFIMNRIHPQDCLQVAKCEIYNTREFSLSDLSRAGWSAHSTLAAYRDPCTPAGSLSQSLPVFLNGKDKENYNASDEQKRRRESNQSLILWAMSLNLASSHKSAMNDDIFFTGDRFPPLLT